MAYFINIQLSLKLMLSIALYIHIPWCIKKCPYCDFNSHQSTSSLEVLRTEKRYLQALLTDLAHDLHQFSQPTVISSIFIGGGTPSLMSGEFYAELFTNIQKKIAFIPNVEITLEANPGAIDQTYFSEYLQAGINRLSLGVQSFNINHLKQLGRIHCDKQAHQAIKLARQAGFVNINIDLMHGLPQQTPQEALTDLSIGIACAVEHISWYQLTIEPNTIFYKTRPLLPSNDVCADIERDGHVMLDRSGFKRYEISAFSKPQYQSQHNLNYWLFGDYLGIGAGAHGKITQYPDYAIYRTRKHRQPETYLQANTAFLVSNDLLDIESICFEFMLNCTRLQQKIPFSWFFKRTGLPFAKLLPKLTIAQDKNFIYMDQNSWQITDFGRRFTNDLQELFLPG